MPSGFAEKRRTELAAAARRILSGWVRKVPRAGASPMANGSPLYGFRRYTLPRFHSFRGGIEYLPKELPTGACPALQPHLRVVHVVLVARIDAYAGQQRRQRQILQAL